MYKNLLMMLLVAALLSAPAWAEPLETPFFTLEVPSGWTVGRNSSGLWQVTAPGPEPLEALISAGRLQTSPELYIQATSKLWRSLGEVKPLQPWLADRPNQAWFLVKHSPRAGQKPMTTVKWVRWRGDLLVVTSFSAPAESLQSWSTKIRSIALGMKLLKPVYDEDRLLEEVQGVLTRNEDSRESLTDLEAIKLAKNMARQNWEPFFASDQPPLYRTYAEYLEARFDAAFAIANGKELGMGADVVESRLQSLANHREDLRRESQGF